MRSGKVQPPTPCGIGVFALADGGWRKTQNQRFQQHYRDSTFPPHPALFALVRMTPALLELDALVINVELTLASIIQGVALYFLTDNARSIFSTHDFARWLYVFSGLIIILIFWSRSLTHTLTLIRWPLEFGHNFLYITCALGEALLFTRLTDPVSWFEVSSVYAIGIWLLFFYDLRLVRPREVDRPSKASQQLCAVIESDQRRNIRWIVPGLFAYGVLSVALMKMEPEFFLRRHGHVWLAAGQVVGLLAYLRYSLRFFRVLAPIIAQRQEERISLISGGKS